MPRTKNQLHGIKTDKKGFTKALDERLQVINRNGARSWLRAIFVHVPVWTGEARGSLKFAQGAQGGLAAFLNVAIPISPVKEIRPGKDQFTGGLQARYKFTTGEGRHIYGFYFRSDVIQYLLNEYVENVSPTSPWNSQEIGALAYHLQVTKDMKSIPRIKDYILKTNIEEGL